MKKIGLVGLLVATSIVGCNEYELPSALGLMPKGSSIQRATSSINNEYIPINKEERIAPANIETIVESPVSPKLKAVDQEELELISKVVYAESSHEEINNKMIAKVIDNRRNSPEYPDTIWSVIYKDNAFSCTFNGSEQWKKATGKIERNPYEEMVYREGVDDTKEVLQGKSIGIPRENEIIAYHDTSINKPKDRIIFNKEINQNEIVPYWSTLEEVYRNNSFVYYAPKK